MSVEPPFHVYREQLSALFNGLALWQPDPGGVYDRVSIGDVGYISDNGAFIRMFNVTLSWDDPSNRRLGKPDQYDPLILGDFTTVSRTAFSMVEHSSRRVLREESDGNVWAMTPDQAEDVTYRCRGRGAILSLPNGGHREDVIHTKAFEEYIRDHAVDWFTWARDNKLGVERMENLILVTGCTLVTSWAAAAFVDTTMDAEISLSGRALDNSGTSFVWRNIQGAVVYHNSQFNSNRPITADQCVFIRGFRAKRVFFRTRPIRAAAEPLPDDPDNRQEDGFQVSSVSCVSKYDDPLIGVLDYIAEECLEGTVAEDTIAIAHDDDLKVIEGVETPTADAIEEFLREKRMPLLVENGAAMLCSRQQARQQAIEYAKSDKSTSHLSTTDTLDIYTGPSDLSQPPPMCHSTATTPSGLPSLPEISSERILEQIFTHRSLLRRPKRVFEDSPNEGKLDNEQLINIGDQVFSVVVTDLIQDVFPNLSSGPSSKVRDRLRYHGKLAKIAVKYGLHERLRVQAAQADEVKRSAHAQAEVFKAYVGGLCREQGLDVVQRWLRSLFLLDIKEAYEAIRGEYFLPPV